MGKSAVSPQQFSSFGELLKHLRRRAQMTQMELAIQVGYSDTQISRLEQNQRVPNDATLTALFVPALHLEREAEWVARLLELAKQARLGEQPETHPAERADAPNNLPAALTTFIGREKEQPELIQFLRKHRLVTLTGSGGVGKTRLSLQVAGQLLGEFADGVYFVELASLDDPALVPQTVATAFGIATQADVPHTQRLVQFIRNKAVLLILDNCEHLVDACGDLTNTLLKQCPHLKILATSREALGVPGELNYRLPSLGIPDPDQVLDDIGEYEAVRLFQERAQLAQPDFAVTPENAAAVAQICCRLDGIPLAIELAAARVTVFTPAQIAERLDEGFNLLTGGSRTVLPRQQTIRASIDWSWNLLSDAERTLLRRLTVFSGGWTLQAAELICSDANVDPVSEWMSQLVSKSLVSASHEPERERRFYLHETVRQYASEKLVQAGEESHIRSRHLAYFLEFVRRAAPALHGPQQMEWYRRLSDERGNLRAALEYASEADLEAGLYLASGLLDHWYAMDVREGLRWTGKLIASPSALAFPHARAKAMVTHANFLWNLQQFDDARALAEKCLDFFRASGDREGEFDSLISLGRAMQFLGGMKARSVYHRQALTLAREMGDVWRQADALSMLGWDQRDPAQGRAHWEEAIALLRQTGDWMYLARILGSLGFTVLSNGDVDSADRFLNEAYALSQKSNDKKGSEFILTGKSYLSLQRGEYAQARAFMQENITMLAEAGNRMGLLWGRARLANIALHEGKVAEAQPVLVEVTENFFADRNWSGLVFALELMARLDVDRHKPAAAAQLVGWSDAMRRAIGDPRPRLGQDELDRVITAAMAELGTDAYQAAYQAGEGMTPEEAVRFALEKR